MSQAHLAEILQSCNVTPCALLAQPELLVN